ncbi:hypothetical protein L0156_21535 [bacterium]|nr:hypothetical protein [bacterium]
MRTISSLFGYQAGIINQAQFSVLVAVAVASATLRPFWLSVFSIRIMRLKRWEAR